MCLVTEEYADARILCRRAGVWSELAAPSPPSLGLNVAVGATKIWIAWSPAGATPLEIAYATDTTFTTVDGDVAPMMGPTRMWASPTDALWVYGPNRGLQRYANGAWTSKPPAAGETSPYAAEVTCIHGTSDDDVWIGGPDTMMHWGGDP
jgi:hypothetical protein